MNTFCTMFRVVVLLGVVCVNGVSAVSPSIPFDVATRHLGRNTVAATMNKNFTNFPSVQAVNATLIRTTEKYCKDDNNKNAHIIMQQEVPYLVVNYGLRKAVQYASNNGYDVNALVTEELNVIPEVVKVSFGSTAPVAEESLYDLATAAIVLGARIYVVPILADYFKK